MTTSGPPSILDSWDELTRTVRPPSVHRHMSSRVSAPVGALATAAVVIALLALLSPGVSLGPAASASPAPSGGMSFGSDGGMASHPVTCGPPPIFKGAYQIQLNCAGAIAAALAALPAGHPMASSLVFAWGIYCPPGTPCATPAVLLETGYVVVGYIDGTTALITVRGEAQSMVDVTGVRPLPTVGPQ